VNLQSIYLNSPIALQNIIVNAEGWRLNRRRYGGSYHDIFAATQKRSLYSSSELHHYSLKKLQEFFYIADRSNYWNKQFKRYSVNVDSNEPFFELSKLPLLTKTQVKENVDDISLNQDSSVLSRHTSGTTGSGLKFQETVDMERITWATWWRYRMWHGINRGNWCGYFGGRSIVPISQVVPPYWRINRNGRQILFSGHHLSSQTASYYAKALVKHNITWLHGYPSMLVLFAGYVIDQGLRTPNINIVTTGAENLLYAQKQLIEDAFNAPVVQHYGLSEGVANISECTHGSLHVDEDYSFVEFQPLDDFPGHFKVVGTNWHNPSFPLFRYDTNDIVIIDKNNKCSCGLPGRLVKSIDGRQEDYIVLPSGVKIGRMDHVFKDLINIREAQLIQNNSNQLLVRIVRAKNYNNHDERNLLHELRLRLGDDISIKFDYVDSINRASSGKLRFVIRE